MMLSDDLKSSSEKGWNLGFLIIVSVRDPASLVKPLKESATDEEKAAREVKLAESKPKVSLLFSNAYNCISQSLTSFEEMAT